MQNLYIDESGSMTVQYCSHNPYFIIAIVRSADPDKLKKLHSRFVRSHLAELKEADTEGRMFKNGKFTELKGSMFTPELKKAFVSYFCQNDALEVFYIILDNSAISKDKNLYANKARAFNYVLKLALRYFICNRLLPDEPYTLQLDERNESTETRHFLKNYLNTELRMEGILSNDISVTYYDSSQNRIIQIADVFANLRLSQLRTHGYTEEFNFMRKNGYLKFEFKFPPTTSLPPENP